MAAPAATAATAQPASPGTGPELATLRASLLQMLEARDAVQKMPFLLIIQQYARLQQDYVQYKLKYVETDARAKELSNKLAEAQRQLVALQKSTSESVIVSAKVTELEQKKAQMLEQLTELYREKAELSKTMLSMREEAQRTAERMELKEKELSASRDEILALRRELEEVREELASKNVMIGVLNDEMRSLQAQFADASEKSRKLQTEYDQLLERFLRRAQEEAERMNELQMSLRADKQRERLEAALQAVPAPLASLQGAAAMSWGVPVDVNKKFESGDDVNCVEFNADGTLLAVGADACVRLYDTRTGTTSAQLRNAQQAVMCVSFTLDGGSVLGGCNDGAARLWDLRIQRIKHTFTGHSGKIYSAFITANQKAAVTGSHDRSLKVWDLGSGYCTKTLYCPSGVNAVCGSVDGSLYFSGHIDGHVRVWSAAKGEHVKDLGEVHGNQVTSVSAAPDGMCVLSNSRDHTLKLIDVRMFEVVRTFSSDAFRNGVNWNKACFSPDGRFVAGASADGSVVIWSADSGKVETVLKRHKLRFLFFENKTAGLFGV